MSSSPTDGHAESNGSADPDRSGDTDGAVDPRGSGEGRGDPVLEWKQAFEAGDAAAAVRCSSDDVVMISPLTARYRFTGRAQLLDVLAAAFEVISDVSFHTDVGEGATRALFYRAQVGNIALEECQLLRLDDAQRIAELTVFGRPLPALTAVLAGIGPRLLRRQGHGRMAPIAGAAVAPLAALTRLGEQYLVPLGDPARSRTRP